MTTDLLWFDRDEAAGRATIGALVQALTIGALVEALYALRDLVEASESVHVYPEGAAGIDDLREAERKARAVLDRFDWSRDERPQ